jgi:hypothetical protein
MAKIPLPERGQPLDLSYIYQVATAINDISSEISPSIYKYVSIDTPTAGPQNIRASESRIIAGYQDVAINSNVNSGNQQTFSYSFKTDFKYPPIVTATLINIGNTPAGQNVSVILTNVSTSAAEGVVKFNSSGDLSVGVNLIAIGVPN